MMPSSSGKQQQRCRSSNSARVPMPMTMPMTISKKWELTPLPLLLRTLGYLDNATLMRMCLVCQQIRDLIWNGQGMENQLIRVFELQSSARKHTRIDMPRLLSARLRHFLDNMARHFNDPTKHRMLQQYQYWKLTHGGQYYDFDNGFDYSRDVLEQVTRTMSMPGILSLNASSPVRVMLSYGLLTAIFRMVPNLQELDLSNVDMSTESVGFGTSAYRTFSRRCPQLEKISWNFSTTRDERTGYLHYIDADGWWMEELRNLRELSFDNCVFNFLRNVWDQQLRSITEYECMSDLHNHPEVFFFSNLRHLPLERLSIRNMNYIEHTAAAIHLGTAPTHHPTVRSTISQNLLIKFVRNAPSTLVWFRSDLSAANIRMLQLERPGIEFVT